MSAVFGDRILILIPHPDDEVVGCFAAAGRAAASGAKLFGYYLTTGVPAADLLWPWDRKSHPERVRNRREEAVAAAELMNIQPVGFRETPTRRFRFDLGEVRSEVLRLISEREIDTVWVPAFEGAHQDHDAANALANTLRPKASVFEFAEYNNFGGRTRSQEFPESKGTETVIELTTEEVERKRAALAVYRSERGNLAHIESARECFRPLSDHDYSKPPHPGTLFYARFRWVPIPHPRVDFTAPEEVYATLDDFMRQRGEGGRDG